MIDRVLYKLDDLVRPYVHKILVVIEPLLIDEDYYARVEGREIISNLAKAAGDSAHFFFFAAVYSNAEMLYNWSSTYSTHIIRNIYLKFLMFDIKVWQQ